MSRIARLTVLFAALTLATAASATPTPAPAATEAAPHAQGPAASVQQIRAALLARRQHNLAVLHAYRVAGVFPINTSQPGEGHFLIDAKGTYCAVANLIAQDGHADLVRAAARRDNALLFGDVKDGPLHDWILTSGFTQAEIARIQVPAPYVDEGRRQDMMLARANQKVKSYLTGIERTLRDDQDAGLDGAVAALAHHPDLVAALLHPAGRVQVAGADRASDPRFATPPAGR